MHRGVCLCHRGVSRAQGRCRATVWQHSRSPGNCLSNSFAGMSGFVLSLFWEGLKASGLRCKGTGQARTALTEENNHTVLVSSASFVWCDLKKPLKFCSVLLYKMRIESWTVFTNTFFCDLCNNLVVILRILFWVKWGWQWPSDKKYLFSWTM